MKDLHSPPRALILCADERLARMLECELTRIGVAARVTDSMPTPDEALCLIVADGDAFPLAPCEDLAQACQCPLLIFGRALLNSPSANVSFLRRPFALTDLEQTVSALLGRYEQESSSEKAFRPHRAIPHTPPSPTPVLSGDTVTVGDRRIPLTPAEQSILSYLMSHSGQTVPRDTLATLLEGGGNSVDVYVCRLRAKIEKPLGRRMIVTVRGVGYCMNE
jgi:hypothetical protein